MVARLAKAVLFAWAAVWVGWLAVHLARGEPAWAWAGALVIAGAHAEFLGFEFVCMQVINRHDPAPRASLRQAVSAWISEVRVATRIFCWQQPFFSQREPDHLPPDAAGRTGVVLVHGFACNRGFWNRWMPRLRAAGIPYIAVNLEPPFGPMEPYLPIIEAAVQRLQDATGQAPLLVGHSMGGMALRAWVCAGGAPRSAGLITIGTPHRGTRWAAYALPPNARQMRCGSHWIEALEQAETGQQPGAAVTCYYSHCDNIVVPASGALLSGATVRHIAAAGHVHLAECPQILDDVLHRLAGRRAEHIVQAPLRNQG